MARTPSTMVALGTKAPDFKLPDTISGKQITLNEIKGDVATVIMFICNHANKGVGFAAISSNDVVNHPEDSPSLMKMVAQQLNYPFPYLYDESQDVAKAYDAACTPDFFIYDQHLRLVYRGQLDDSRPGNEIPVTGKDIRYALDRLIKNETVPEFQRPSIGCNIKWKQ
jgi:peroxiredoxin